MFHQFHHGLPTAPRRNAYGHSAPPRGTSTKCLRPLRASPRHLDEMPAASPRLPTAPRWKAYGLSAPPHGTSTKCLRPLHASPRHLDVSPSVFPDHLTLQISSKPAPGRPRSNCHFKGSPSILACSSPNDKPRNLRINRHYFNGRGAFEELSQYSGDSGKPLASYRLFFGSMVS